MTPWIAVGTHTRSEIYHTQRDCPRLKQADDPKQLSKEQVNRQSRRLCEFCKGNRNTSGYTEWHEINAELKDPETTL